MSIVISYESFGSLLKNIVDNRGKTCPTTDKGIALIATNCIVNNHLYPLYEKVRYVSEEVYKSWFRDHPKPGDMIFVLKGTPGRVAWVPDPVDFCIAQDMVAIRADEKKIYPKYLFAVLRSDLIQQEIESLHVGSLIPHFKKSDFDDLKIPIVEPKLQEYIGNLYFDISLKIDLLHRQNKTLEAMAETLFRQWFVEEADEGWEEYTLDQLVETANTGLDAIRRAPIVEEETGIKCLRIQDISQNKSYHNWGNTKVTASDFEKAKLRKDDIIMARTCLPGIIYYVRQDLNAVFNNGLARIRPNKEKTYSIFLYYLFKTDDFIGHIYGISDGTSVQLNMKLGDLLSYKIKFPPKELQDKYFPTFQDLNNKILFNKIQIQNLINLRDTLLPKLMSGEVRVNV